MESGAAAVYEQVAVSHEGHAPLTFARDLSSLRHDNDNCEFGREGGSVPCSSSSREHSARSICACMTPFQMDREMVAELLSRELVADAFFSTLSVVREHGPQAVLKDMTFYQVVSRFDHMSSFYATIGSCERTGSDEVIPELVHPRLKAESFDTSVPIRECIKSKDLWVEFLRLYEQLPISHHMGVFDSLKTDWVTCLDNGNLFAAYRFDPEEPRKCTIRLDAVVDCTLLGVLAVMSEVGMTESWVPYIRFPMHVGLQEARELSKLGRLEKASLYRIELPWPVSNREVYLHGWIVDDLDYNGNLVMSFRGIDPDYPVNDNLAPIRTPEATEKFVPIYVEGGCSIRQLRKRKISLSLVWNIDLKMSIPTTLLGFVTKTFVKLGINSLADVCNRAETDPTWQELAYNNPWLYKYMHTRIETWLKEQGIEHSNDDPPPSPKKKHSTTKQQSANSISSDAVKKPKLRKRLFRRTKSNTPNTNIAKS